jgi:hypothetical protein
VKEALGFDHMDEPPPTQVLACGPTHISGQADTKRSQTLSLPKDEATSLMREGAK